MIDRPTVPRLILAVMLQFAACGGSEIGSGPEALRHEVETIGGIRTVHNSGAPPRWTLTPMLDLGSTGTAGEAAPDEFGRIVSLTPDPYGRLWIADGMNSEIRVFDGDGTLALRLGRPGEGPREFGSLYSLAWIGDKVLALDFGNGRVTEISSTGEWLGTRRAPGRLTGSPSTLRLYPVGDSTAYQFSLRATDGQWTWVEHGPTGIMQELEQHEAAPPVNTLMVCERPDGATYYTGIPFAGRVLRHPARGGNQYVAWSADYRLSLVSPAGDTLQVIERARPLLPVTDDEWERESAEFDVFRDEWPGAECTPSGMARPDHKAAMMSLLVDRAGRIWVEVPTELGSEWEIFEPDGRLVGSLPGFEYDDRVAPALGDTLLAWVDQDSLGVQRAHLAHIRR